MRELAYWLSFEPSEVNYHKISEGAEGAWMPKNGKNDAISGNIKKQQKGVFIGK
jgi:hypothetical protein